MGKILKSILLLSIILNVVLICTIVYKNKVENNQYSSVLSSVTGTWRYYSGSLNSSNFGQMAPTLTRVTGIWATSLARKFPNEKEELFGLQQDFSTFNKGQFLALDKYTYKLFQKYTKNDAEFYLKEQKLKAFLKEYMSIRKKIG